VAFEIIAFNISETVDAEGERLALLDIRLNDEVTIRRCILLRTDSGCSVRPPRGRKAGDLSPASWNRRSAFATELNVAAKRAYEAITGRALD
jgi:hypothetical protein